MFRPSRRAVVVAAVLAVAAAAGTTVALATRRPPGATSLDPLNTGGDAPPAASESPTPSTSPSPSPTMSPTPSRTAAPAVTATSKPRTSSTSGGGDSFFGPHPPGSVTMPYVAGQRSWDATSNGITVHIEVTPVFVGKPATWTITASSKYAGCCALYLLYGDGYGATPSMECDKPDASVAYTHTYNRAGVHRFMVQAGTAKSCGASGDGSFYGSFDVGPGTSTAQGPSLPTVAFDTSTPVPGHENDPSYVSLYGEVDDIDGWISKLVVTFGDGTSKTFPGDVNPCRNGPDGWPGGSRVWLPHEPPPYHHYTKPGSYTLTLTAYSSGCDGSQVQTGKKSFQWHVPAPESPSPSASG